jgi:hypothetical protein
VSALQDISIAYFKMHNYSKQRNRLTVMKEVQNIMISYLLQHILFLAYCLNFVVHILQMVQIESQLFYLFHFFLFFIFVIY